VNDGDGRVLLTDGGVKCDYLEYVVTYRHGVAHGSSAENEFCGDSCENGGRGVVAAVFSSVFFCGCSSCAGDAMVY
jgi:hypothetical protein